MGFRGYELTLANLISKVNICMMQAIRRLDPECGLDFNLCDVVGQGFNSRIRFIFMVVSEIWYNSSLEEFIFNLRKLKGRIYAMEEGDLFPKFDIHCNSLKSA
jgi:hypothetical protein